MISLLPSLPVQVAQKPVYANANSLHLRYGLGPLCDLGLVSNLFDRSG